MIKMRGISKFLHFIKGEDKLKKKANKKKKHAEEKEIALPEAAWDIIFNHSSPIDIVKWRRMNKTVKNIIDDRLSRVLYLDVWRMDTNALLPRTKDNDGDFFRVAGTPLLLHLDSHSCILVSSPYWSSKDVDRLWNAVKMFRRCCKTLTLDASVAEMVVAGISLSSDLSRWLTSRRKRLAKGRSLEDRLNNNAHSHHHPSLAACSSSTGGSSRGSSHDSEDEWTEDDTHPEAFFPSVREFTIRMTSTDSAALLSLPSYNIAPSLLVPLHTLQLLRLHLVGCQPGGGGGWKAPVATRSDVLPTHTPPASHLRLRPFKAWLRVDRLGEKYCQQYT